MAQYRFSRLTFIPAAAAARVRSRMACNAAIVSAGFCIAGSAFSQTGVAPPADRPASLETPTQSEIRVLAPATSPAEQSAQVGGLSQLPIAETPQSISVLRASTLRDEGAGTLSSAIRSEPSVANFYNTTGYVESLQIRGFLLDNALNYRRDGMPISNFAPAGFENRQSIEILKGVSGVQAGSSAPGGLVNYSIKRPSAIPLRELTVGLSERGTSLWHLDLGGRFGEDQLLGYRFNVGFEDKRPMADNARGKREFVSGFFDFRLPARSLLEAEFEYQRSSQPSVPGFGLLDTTGSGVASTLPSPVNPRTNLGAQSWAQPYEARNLVASLRFSQTLANDWVWGARVSRQNIRSNDRLAFPDGCSSGANYVYPGFCGNGDFDLYDFRSENERRNLSYADLYLRGEVRTGAIRHELNAGVSQTYYGERFNPQQAYNFVGIGNQFTPVDLPADPTPSSLNTQSDSRTRQFWLSDAIQFDNAWSLWLGLRHSRLDRSSERTDGSQATRYEQSFTTPWGALGYKPWAGGYGYLSAGSGVESEVVPNRPSLFTNAGVVLPALRSNQKELGFKQILSGGGLAHVAVFQISKPFSDDVIQSDGRSLRVAGGRELRHQGIELGWAGPVSRNWSINAQATLIDTKALRSVDDSLQGKRTPNVAPITASVAATWQVPQLTGLHWTNRVFYSDKKAVTRDNSVELPSFWQLDSYLTYRQKLGATQLSWRAGIDNVTDKRYWRDAPTQYWGGTYLFPAPPRTFRVSVQASF